MKKELHSLKKQKDYNITPLKIPKGLWQITLPLSMVLIFLISSLIMISMLNGYYLLEGKLTPKSLEFKTEINKTKK